MDRRHMSDGRIGGQQRVQSFWSRRGILGRAQHRVGNPSLLEHEEDALAVGAVGQHGHLAFGRDGALEHRFHAEGAAALHQNGFPARLARHPAKSEKGLSHLGHQVVELPVPRTGVVEHGLLDR